jgi:hypothetical protein
MHFLSAVIPENRICYLPPAFIYALAGAVSLRELYVEGMRVADVAALGRLTSLTSLLFNIPMNRHAYPLTPIALLRQLKFLSICESASMGLEGLEIVLVALSDLRELHIPDFFNVAQITALPRSLEQLHLSHVMPCKELTALAEAVVSGQFKELQCIKVSNLTLESAGSAQELLDLAETFSKLCSLGHQVLVDHVDVDHTGNFFLFFNSLREAAMSICYLQFQEELAADQIKQVSEMCPSIISEYAFEVLLIYWS